MSTGSKTLEEIRRAGIGALARELGSVGMIRFLQQFETGAGDYSVDRHSQLERSDVRSLAKKIGQNRRDLNRSKRREVAFSDREREVLACVGEGLTNREIARKLSIRPDAVRLHLQRIIDKIGVKDRTQGVEYVAEHNIQPRLSESAPIETSPQEQLQAHLMATNEEFRRLASEYVGYTGRLEELSSQPQLTEQEQLEEVRLKKLKLQVKDKMQNTLKQARASRSPRASANR